MFLIFMIISENISVITILYLKILLYLVQLGVDSVAVSLNADNIFGHGTHQGQESLYL